MEHNPEASKAAAALVSMRWNRLNSEQRREATRKATEASLRARAAKKAAREAATQNGGGDTNE